jgi:hypothetical protein
VKETPIFDLPYPESTDAPDGSAQIQAAVERVEELLAQIEDLILGAPEPGQLIVVNGTNDPVYRAITGDLSFNSAGVATIGEEKVATTMIKNLAVTGAKIAEAAVTASKLGLGAVGTAAIQALAVQTGNIANEAVETGKIKPLAVTEAKVAAEAITTGKIANLAVTEGKLADGAVSARKYKATVGEKPMTAESVVLGEAYADLTGCKLEITPNVASVLRVTGIFDVTIIEAEGEFEGSVKVDAEAEKTPLARFRTTAVSSRATVTQSWVIPLTAAAHTITLRAKRGPKKVTVFKSGTQMIYELFAA